MTALIEIISNMENHYDSIDAYIDAVVTWLLLYRSWHYTEETARERVEGFRKYVERCYREKVPADDVAIDIGYCCG